jgi:hypothetical protein
MSLETTDPEARQAMVQIRSREPVMVYEVMDCTGNPIGEVRDPVGEPVMGRGEGTVLLRREIYRGTGRD